MSGSAGLDRLLQPKSIAVIGGGAWCRSVIQRCLDIGFKGPVWPVHPREQEVCGLPAYASVADLPDAPDASFIGVNRKVTVDVVAALHERGAGGAVCFAAGFREAANETGDGADLEAALLEAAGKMPVLGPNCYGFINYLDCALLWPDVHGGECVERGVAIIAQSSNVALNMTMQTRGLPLAYLITVGNQAQTGIAGIGAALLDDDRVTAIGLYVEGFGDIRAFEAFAAKARALGKPIVAIKTGRSETARAGAISHTASLVGGDAGAEAFMERLGIARVASIGAFLETLKLLHVVGPLPSNRIASMSCSGGEASLIADLALAHDIEFPALNETQKVGLRAALGSHVALANPLDYNTYIWRDVPRMTATYAAMMDPSLALTCLILDLPRADRCDPVDWECAIASILAAKQRADANVAVIASLPELLPEPVIARLMDGGIAPLNGMPEALEAIEAAAKVAILTDASPLLLPKSTKEPIALTEAEAKAELATFGVPVPTSIRVTSPERAGHAAGEIGFPVVLKGEGIAHKTEAGAVRLNLMSAEAVEAAARDIPCDSFLVEQMISDSVTELLIGVVLDEAHGYLLTLGAGGTLTELLDDRASVLLPATDTMIEAALDQLKIAKLLDGYRGGPTASRVAILAVIKAVQDYVIAHGDGLSEIEINPLICGRETAIAADVLILREKRND